MIQPLSENYKSARNLEPVEVPHFRGQADKANFVLPKLRDFGKISFNSGLKADKVELNYRR